MRTLQSSPMSMAPKGQSVGWRCQFLLSGLLLFLLLCGCARNAKWKKESFALASPVGEAGSAAHTNVLSLHRVTVAPMFDAQPLVYRTGEDSYERDPYAEFFVSPNRMFEQCLRIYLRNGHAFADVLNPGSNLKSSCSMEVSVSELYGDFRKTDQPFAALQMRFLLYGNESTNRGRVLWQREFSKRLPVAYRTPKALVEGWNAGLRQIMDEVNAELEQLSIPEVMSAKTGIKSED